jgi:hypothetical protein
MKTKIASLLLALAASTALRATPLTETTAVHAKPDAGSTVITYFKAGSEPAPAVDTANATTGWMAVELPGPFEAYVLNKDLTKSLDVVPGTPLTLAPKVGAPVLTNATAEDKTTVTGLYGKWTQIKLERKLIAYIPTKEKFGSLASAASAPVAQATAAVPAPFAPAPANPVAYGTGGAGRAAPMVKRGDGGSSTLPRQFSGKFVSTRRPFTPRRPYDWALNDDAGRRYAYLDVSKLLLTEQIDKYIDHAVVVYGSAKNANDGKDIVIEIESLQLR